MITTEKVEKILKELRLYPNLQVFRDVKGEEYCREHQIKVYELNFLVNVVNTERLNRYNQRLKTEILSRRKVS